MSDTIRLISWKASDFALLGVHGMTPIANAVAICSKP